MEANCKKRVNFLRAIQDEPGVTNISVIELNRNLEMGLVGF